MAIAVTALVTFEPATDAGAQFPKVAFHTGSAAKIQREQNALEFSDRKGHKEHKK
jgi:hypothetical protein